MTKANYVLKARLGKEEGRNGMKGIKPSPGLVYCLTDIVSREALLKNIPIPKGIMPLGNGHSPGVKPAIDYLREAKHPALASGTTEANLINERAVKV
jgi:hypothetical protein